MFLTIKETAELLKVSTMTVKTYIKVGKLKSIKLGDNTAKRLIPKEEVLKLLRCE